MSQENVEIVRRAYEAFNQGDLEGMVADFAPGFDFWRQGRFPAQGPVFEEGQRVGESL